MLLIGRWTDCAAPILDWNPLCSDNLWVSRNQKERLNRSKMRLKRANRPTHTRHTRTREIAQHKGSSGTQANQTPHRTMTDSRGSSHKSVEDDDEFDLLRSSTPAQAAPTPPVHMTINGSGPPQHMQQFSPAAAFDFDFRLSLLCVHRHKHESKI